MAKRTTAKAAKATAKAELTIAPPNFQVAEFRIRGTAAYVQNKFSAKSTAAMKGAQEAGQAELDKVEDKYDRKMDTIVSRLKREQRELEEDQSELSQRKMEEYGTHAETVLSLFSRRKKSLSRSLSKRRMAEKAEADVKESIQAIEEYEKQIKDIQADEKEALEEVNKRWEEIASQASEIEITPYKKDILVELFGVAWYPHYVVKTRGEITELQGYSSS